MATYNEAASIGPVLGELDEAATTLRRAGIELDVLLVDDDSPDGTADVARREAERFGLALEVVSAALEVLNPSGPLPSPRSWPDSVTSITSIRRTPHASSSRWIPMAATMPARSRTSSACSSPAAAG